MLESMDGPATKQKIFDLAKSIEAMLPILTNDLREIKEIIGRIERHFQQIGR